MVVVWGVVVVCVFVPCRSSLVTCSSLFQSPFHQVVTGVKILAESEVRARVPSDENCSGTVASDVRSWVSVAVAVIAMIDDVGSPVTCFLSLITRPSSPVVCTVGVLIWSVNPESVVPMSEKVRARERWGVSTAAPAHKTRADVREITEKIAWFLSRMKVQIL